MNLKITASWCHPVEAGTIADKVKKAGELGFNAYAWTADCFDAELIKAVRQNKMKAYKVIEPLTRREGAVLQQLEPGEENLPGTGETDALYQYGGEPANGRSEVLNSVLICPQDKSVTDYAAAQIKMAHDMGYDGVCWDFIGYMNYGSCSCELCRQGLEEYIGRNPLLTLKQAKDRFYEDKLVELYAKLYDMVKSIAPEMPVMCHCHPVFQPNHFYGHRIKCDYCGITVSWFFKPHWDMKKVREYINNTVKGPYSYKQTVGMPMIGYYSFGVFENHVKNTERVSQEIDAISEANAQAMMFCELDSLLERPGTAEAVRSKNITKKLLDFAIDSRFFDVG